MTTELLSIPLERTLPHIGRRLMILSSQQQSKSVLLKRSLGRGITRGSALLANAITLPFEIRSAMNNFDQAAAPGISDQERQDFLFAGSLDVASFSITLALGAGVALKASFATVAGPLGIAAGLILVSTAQLYSAIRQVELINQYAHLSSAERLHAGWLAFWGMEQSRNLTERVRLGHTQNQFKIAAEQLLRNLTAEFDTIVYGTILFGNSNPLDNGAIETAKEHILYRNQIINVTAGVNDQTLPGKNYVTQPPLASHKKILFDLGNGDNILTGVGNKPNQFNLRSGQNNITGGVKEDLFIIEMTASETARQLDKKFYYLDGGIGYDILLLQAELPRGYSGYHVDLKQGKICPRLSDNNDYSFMPCSNPLILLRNIEQVIIQTLPKNSHYIIGSDNSELLEMGENDILHAGDGNDHIVIKGGGTAHGEGGLDIYNITQIPHTNLTIYEIGSDTSIVVLPIPSSQLSHWRLNRAALLVNLGHRANASILTLIGSIIFDGDTIGINSAWNFWTSDGLQLTPQLNDTPSLNQTEKINFMVTYSKDKDKNYYNTTCGIKIDLQNSLLNRCYSVHSNSTNSSLINLPNNYQLQLIGTIYDDVLIGNDQANILYSQGGEDILQGGGNRDQYIITAAPGHTIINNSAQDEIEDFVLLPCPFTQLFNGMQESSLREGNHLVMSFPITSNDAASNTTIRHGFHQITIQNFYTREKNHLTLIDINGMQRPLEHDAQGHLQYHWLGSKKNDSFSLPKKKFGILFGMGGNDMLYAGDAGSLLNGGAGNDRLRDGKGNDTLLGGDGDDHLQLLSSGTDRADGGFGINHYEIGAAATGEKTIINQSKASSFVIPLIQPHPVTTTINQTTLSSVKNPPFLIDTFYTQEANTTTKTLILDISTLIEILGAHYVNLSQAFSVLPQQEVYQFEIQGLADKNISHGPIEASSITSAGYIYKTKQQADYLQIKLKKKNTQLSPPLLFSDLQVDFITKDLEGPDQISLNNVDDLDDLNLTRTEDDLLIRSKKGSTTAIESSALVRIESYFKNAIHQKITLKLADNSTLSQQQLSNLANSAPLIETAVQNNTQPTIEPTSSNCLESTDNQAEWRRSLINKLIENIGAPSIEQQSRILGIPPSLTSSFYEQQWLPPPCPTVPFSILNQALIN